MRSNRARRYGGPSAPVGPNAGHGPLAARAGPADLAVPPPPPVPSRLAPAKVNLGLHVLSRRPDGFHDLATVFVPLGWSDRLAAAPAPDLTLTTTDPALPTDGGNLVVRAAVALRQWAAAQGTAPAGARLHLDKRVPYGAGLGSGSSDAAATLRLLAELWDLSVPPADLAALALGLGSDVPFFLDPVPAHATGRGERLVRLVGADGSAWRCPFWLVVAVPDVHVSTAGAFAGVVPSDRGRPDLAAAVVSDDPGRWRAEVTNDFQRSVETAHPAVRDVRERLEAAGAELAVLSGTGSAVVGVFGGEAAARRAAAGLGHCRVWVEPPGA